MNQKIDLFDYFIQCHKTRTHNNNNNNNNDNNNNNNNSKNSSDDNNEYKWELDSLDKHINNNNENLLYIATVNSQYDALLYLFNESKSKHNNIKFDLNYQCGNDKNRILHACIDTRIGYDNTHGESSVINCDNYKCLMLILSESNQINPNIENSYGETAFDCCERMDKLQFLKELRKIWPKHE